MNEQMLMAIYAEYINSNEYKQFKSYEDAVAKMDLLLQSMEDLKEQDKLEESSSEVTIRAEEQGFYNGFQCAIRCVLGGFAVKVANLEA